MSATNTCIQTPFFALALTQATSTPAAPFQKGVPLIKPLIPPALTHPAQLIARHHRQVSSPPALVPAAADEAPFPTLPLEIPAVALSRARLPEIFTLVSLHSSTKEHQSPPWRSSIELLLRNTWKNPVQHLHWPLWVATHSTHPNILTHTHTNNSFCTLYTDGSLKASTIACLRHYNWQFCKESLDLE